MKLEAYAYVGTVLTLMILVCCDNATCKNVSLCVMIPCPPDVQSQGKIGKRSIVPRSLNALIEKMQSHQLSQRGMRLRRLQPSEFLGKRSIEIHLPVPWKLPAIKRANEMLGKRSSNGYSGNSLLSGPLTQFATNSENNWYKGRSRRGPHRSYHGNEFLGKRSDKSSSVNKT